MKECYCCKEIKQTSEFFKDSSKKDNLYYICKDCLKKKNYYKKPNSKEYNSSYYLKNKDKVSQYKKRWHARNINKCKVRAKAHYHIKRGNILRPNKCSVCGIECKPDAHHEDYSSPLEIIWLCRSCHLKKHRSLI